MKLKRIVVSEKNRQEQIALIIAKLNSEGSAVTVFQIQKELRNLTKPIIIDDRTVYMDMVEVSKKNTFVRDLAQYSYSKLCQDAWNNYSWIYNEARKCYEKKWILTTKITKKDRNGRIISQRTETRETFQNKSRFLTIMKQAQGALDGLINGRTANVSVALINNEFVTLKEELKIANKKLEEYSENDPSGKLPKRKNITTLF